jgi:sodium-independent sulfate anion transporter 11
LLLFFALESDLFCAVCTFLTCAFWSLEYGIMLGVAIQFVFILYSMSRPKMNSDTKKVRNSNVM